MVTTVTFFFCARVYTLTYIVHARRKQIAYKICRLFYRQTRHFAKVYVCIEIHYTQEGSLCRVQNYGFNIYRRKC